VSLYGSEIWGYLPVSKWEKQINKYIKKKNRLLNNLIISTKGLIKNHKLKNDRQYNGQKKNNKETIYKTLHRKLENPTKIIWVCMNSGLFCRDNNRFVI
jgi:hypothetical protein